MIHWRHNHLGAGLQRQRATRTAAKFELLSCVWTRRNVYSNVRTLRGVNVYV
jgi:hypothetical protein